MKSGSSLLPVVGIIALLIVITAAIIMAEISQQTKIRDRDINLLKEQIARSKVELKACEQTHWYLLNIIDTLKTNNKWQRAKQVNQ